MRKISPAVGSVRCVIIFATVLFPEPDSPTIPNTSPVFREKLMSSTAVKDFLPVVKLFFK